LVAEVVELLDGSVALVVGVGSAVSLVRRCQLIVRIEWPTAMAAFFLPILRASRENWDERQVSRVRAAAHAH